MNVMKDGDNFAVVEGLTKDLIGQDLTITNQSPRLIWGMNSGTQPTSQNTLEDRVGNMIRACRHPLSGDPLGLNDEVFSLLGAQGKDNCVNEDLFTAATSPGSRTSESQADLSGMASLRRTSPLQKYQLSPYQ
ncbi:hypothetical protein CDV31_005295 [Fusarium ambrosium]|uniref:Uncharacterized protein n=1 Tax=Fusarium ambrosium TaxID=131363 RepID=A0A428UKG2_9HYPO|nr:hypothetical protein CDV31_005295 [Fusarium ambrosium]